MTNSDIKEVIPNVEKTFGKIRFLGGVQKVEKNVRTDRGRETKHIANAYALISPNTRKLSVYLPTSVKPKLTLKGEVMLVNPVIIFESTRSGYGENATTYTYPILFADDIKMVGGEK